MVRATLLIGMLLALGAFHLDPRWVAAGSDANGSSWYIDGQRSRLLGSHPTVWVRIDHSRDRTLPYRTSIQELVIDCTTFRYHTVESIAHYPDGHIEVMAAESRLRQDRDVTPETVMERVATMACDVARQPVAD